MEHVFQTLFFSISVPCNFISDHLSAEWQLVAVSQLRNILGLGTREAEAISVDFTPKAYRKRLAIHEGILGPPDLMLFRYIV